MVQCDFYLERVGFEAKVNLRHDLKTGENVIGRSYVANIDIGINSLLCSRRHCVIIVSNSAVVIKDLNSSNGTTVNGVKNNGQTVELHEGDLIGIIGGSNPIKELTGNANFMVYRLCKYSSNNIQTFEIEDDEPIVLSDEEDYNNPICLDLDGDESVDSREQYDVGMQLSRNFNIEMKKELMDIDEFEAECKKMKKEPAEFLQGDDGDFNESYQPFASNSVPNEHNNNNHQCDNDSEDSDRTVFFPALNIRDHAMYLPGAEGESSSSFIDNTNFSSLSHQQDSGMSENCVNFGLSAGEVESSSSFIDNTILSSLSHQRVSDMSENCENFGLPAGEGESSNSFTNTESDVRKLSPKEMNDLTIKLRNTAANLNSERSVKAKPLESRNMLAENTIWNSNNKELIDLKQRLQETVVKLNSSGSRKRQLEVIEPKPLPNKRIKNKSVRSPPNGRFKTEKKEEKKEKLKMLASALPKVPIENKTKIQTTAKVKFTPQNRGFFLTDTTQSPGSPKKLHPRQKEKVIINNVIELNTATTPVELEEQIYKNMSCSATLPIISPSEQKIPATLSHNNSRQTQLVNKLSVEVDIEMYLFREEDLDHEFDDSGVSDESFEQNDADDEEDDDDDDEKKLLQIIMQLPPETGTVRLIETEPRPANLKSILKTTNAIGPKKKVWFKEQGFQLDPRHEIISKLTAYNKDEFKTVTDFCRNIDTNISAFADTYDEYEEYRRTLIPLLMVELWKEIELEYANSSIDSFIRVIVNDKNLEKRGDDASLYESQRVREGHLVSVRCDHNEKEIEFIAMVVDFRYSNKLAYFTMETSALSEVLPINVLRIRPITVITNTLNSFHDIYSLKQSPLLDLVLNPLSTQIQPQHLTENISYKGYDDLDETQRRILNTLYKRCIKLDVPNISLLDGAAGTGKTCMIVNLALQLVYGNNLPKPLKILICSKSNGCIDEITAKLINIHDITNVNTKIQLVRFGFLEDMNDAVKKVSVQKIKESEEYYCQYPSYDTLMEKKTVLNLKIQASTLNGRSDNASNIVAYKKQLYKIDALLHRFEGIDKKRLRDKATFILNSCDIVCTTLGSISKLQKYVSQFDVCIMDEATQCNEPLTLHPFRFGMPSLVLVGDSQLHPLAPYSRVAQERNYGNSLFARFQKLFLGKIGSPVLEMHFQYRLHEEILKWPNHQFYKNRLVPHGLVKDTSFPISSYKIISYGLVKGVQESENIMLLIKVLLAHIDSKMHSIGVVCTNFNQKSVMRNKLAKQHSFITTNTCESYLAEKDIIIIWISKQYGMCHLAQQQLLNTAVTRGKKSLLICGANLTDYKNRPIWKSLLENAQSRGRIQHFKTLTANKVCTSLSKKVSSKRGSKCDVCKV